MVQGVLIGAAALFVGASHLTDRDAGKGRRLRQIVLAICAFVAVTIAIRERGDATRETVHVDVEGLDFAGTLYVPRASKAEKHPAVLVLHGSGAMRRASYHFLAHRFASRGFVVLNMDKRGVGASEGEYYGDDLGATVIERRTLDAIPALDFLARHPSVDTARIGVVSISQGGWMAPLLLSGETRARFAINISGAAVSSREEGEWSDWTGEDDDPFGMKPPLEPSEELNVRIRSVAPGGFDPRPHLPRMRWPSLWLFGEWDAAFLPQQAWRSSSPSGRAGLPSPRASFPEPITHSCRSAGPTGTGSATLPRACGTPCSPGRHAFLTGESVRSPREECCGTSSSDRVTASALSPVTLRSRAGSCASGATDRRSRTPRRFR
jgi:predicted dienelactone hydrolase